MNRAEIGKRVAVFALVVVVILAVAGLAPLAADAGEQEPPTLSNPEYDPGSVVTEPIDAEGSVDADVDAGDRGGVVLIDTAHGNIVDRADVAPLAEALSATGHTVRFVDAGDDLDRQLGAADAFVVIDPSREYSRTEVEDVQDFTDRGGRLLLVGEPDRIRVGGLGLSIVTQSSRLTTLGSAYGVAFDTRYLYNLETNDGNYKQIVAEPSGDASLDGVERTTMYTATRVSVQGGTDLLVTVDGTRLSDGGAGSHTVAARSEQVLAVGDRTFLQSDRHTVADNEAFVAYVVEFLAAGEGGEELSDQPSEPTFPDGGNETGGF